MGLQISDALNLQVISFTDHETLFNLMQEIYPPAYKHFWKDEGASYINSQYSKENLSKELLEPNQSYYFILFKKRIIGIMRLLFDHKLGVFINEKASKLHRIYLHQNMQGQGLGKQLVCFAEQLARQNKCNILWLEVMKEQPQALGFYKKMGYKIADSYMYDKQLLYKKYQPMYAVYKKLS